MAQLQERLALVTGQRDAALELVELAHQGGWRAPSAIADEVQRRIESVDLVALLRARGSYVELDDDGVEVVTRPGEQVGLLADH